MNQINIPTSAPISMEALLIALAVGVVLSLILKWHFMTFSKTVTNRENFGNIFLPIICTTAIIIALIKTSLALSLGLIGALSIVRFRTPIKEPEELTYLFVCIAAGLGLGAGQWKITGIAILFLLFVSGLLRLTTRNKKQASVYFTVQSPEQSDTKKYLSKIDTIFNELDIVGDVRRVDTFDNKITSVFLLNLQNQEDLGQLTDKISTEFTGSRITAVDQNQTPTL